MVSKALRVHWQHHQDRWQTLLLLSPVRRARRLVMMRLAAVGLAEPWGRPGANCTIIWARRPSPAQRAAQHPFTTTRHFCFAERWRHCNGFSLTCAVVAHSYCLCSHPTGAAARSARCSAIALRSLASLRPETLTPLQAAVRNACSSLDLALLLFRPPSASAHQSVRGLQQLVG